MLHFKLVENKNSKLAYQFYLLISNANIKVKSLLFQIDNLSLKFSSENILQSNFFLKLNEQNLSFSNM